MNDTKQKLARGLVVSFNATTYQALVQILPSLNNYLTIPVSKQVVPETIATGDSCAVLFFDETNPTDALVLSTYGNAPTPWGLQSFPSGHRVYQNTGVTNGLVVTGITTLLDLSSTPTGVPAGAKAAYCAVQSQPTAAGPLTLYPDGTADPGIASYEANVVGVLNIYYQLVPLSAAGKFSFHAYFNGQLYVDVWGYLV